MVCRVAAAQLTGRSGSKNEEKSRSRVLWGKEAEGFWGYSDSRRLRQGDKLERKRRREQRREESVAVS